MNKINTKEQHHDNSRCTITKQTLKKNLTKTIIAIHL